VAALETEALDTAGGFDCGQVFWTPDQRSFPDSWQGYWTASLRFGFQLVHAGLKTGVSWDSVQFLTTLDGLRKQVKGEMFSGPVAASTVKMKPVPSDKMNRVLGRILEKWQAETDKPGSQPVFEETSDHPDVDETVVFSSAAQEPSFSSDSGMLPPADVPPLDSPDIPPPDTDDWDPDIQETVVFSASGTVPPVDDIDQDDAPVLPPQAPSWNDDIEETVVMRTGSDTPPPVAAPFDDDMDQTVVISPPSHPPGSPPTGNDDPLAATMLQHAPGPPDASFDRSDGDLESTVILNTGAPPAPQHAAPSTDGDLAATMVQGAQGDQPASVPPPGASIPSGGRQIENEDDMDATVIINPAQRSAALTPPLETSTGPADDDLAATLIETPRRTNPSGNPHPPTEPAPAAPPSPPAMPEPPPLGAHADAPSDHENDDDEIMEQTIIIRSDVKKE
jgi:hypothetical protein